MRRSVEKIELKKTLEMNRLFDFYRPLLTPKQQSYLEMYYQFDYSLGEIAEELSVSRQAVYDNIKRSEKNLKSYEDKLHLVTEFTEQEIVLNKLSDYVAKHYNTDETLKEYIEQISTER